MVMEMNSKTNVTNYHSSVPNRHHVRNLWPSIGGGLPGGKPVEPALGCATAPMLQKPPDHYGQSSTSYAQDRPVPRLQMADMAADVNVNSYYYKSSQARSDTDPATANVVAPPPAEYGYYGVQSPPAKYFQHPAATTVHAQQYASQFYHADPTAMFNQVSSTFPFLLHLVCCHNASRSLFFVSTGDVPVPATKVGSIRTDTVLPLSCCVRTGTKSCTPDDRPSDRLRGE